MYSHVEEGKTSYLILILFSNSVSPLSPPLAPFSLNVSPVLASFPLTYVSFPLSSTFFLLFAHILLFPHTGSLIQVPMSEKGKITRGRLGSLSLKKEGERQCFLFSKHLIICTRGSGGKLHLTKVGLCG